jgi:hypothetical protein
VQPPPPPRRRRRPALQASSLFEHIRNDPLAAWHVQLRAPPRTNRHSPAPCPRAALNDPDWLRLREGEAALANAYPHIPSRPRAGTSQPFQRNRTDYCTNGDVRANPANLHVTVHGSVFLPPPPPPFPQTRTHYKTYRTARRRGHVLPLARAPPYTLQGIPNGPPPRSRATPRPSSAASASSAVRSTSSSGASGWLLRANKRAASTRLAGRGLARRSVWRAPRLCGARRASIAWDVARGTSGLVSASLSRPG